MANSVKVGGSIMWAFFDKPNEMSGKYQFDLCNLSAAAVKAIEGLGLSVKTNDDKPEKGSYLTIKSNYAIKAFHPDGSIVEEKVGNGSKAQVVIGSYDWAFKSKKGKSPSAMKIVITDLEVYGGSKVEEEELDDVL